MLGMEKLQHGDVAGVRLYFLRAAEKGFKRSMRALAGTYDPVQLTKFNVHGMQPDADAAREWYEKAGDRDAIAAMDEFFRVSAAAANKPGSDIAQFRAAYIGGVGLAYVVINEDAGEQLYRYGDVSRSNAKKDDKAYTLFTCDTPHVFMAERSEHLAALLKATIVRPGELRFAELDARYPAACNREEGDQTPPSSSRSHRSSHRSR